MQRDPLYKVHVKSVKEFKSEWMCPKCMFSQELNDSKSKIEADVDEDTDVETETEEEEQEDSEEEPEVKKDKPLVANHPESVQFAILPLKERLKIIESLVDKMKKNKGKKENYPDEEFNLFIVDRDEEQEEDYDLESDSEPEETDNIPSLTDEKKSESVSVQVASPSPSPIPTPTPAPITSTVVSLPIPIPVPPTPVDESISKISSKLEALFKEPMFLENPRYSKKVEVVVVVDD